MIARHDAPALAAFGTGAPGASKTALSVVMQSWLDATAALRPSDPEGKKHKANVANVLRAAGVEIDLADYQAARAAMRGALRTLKAEGMALPTLQKICMTLRAIGDHAAGDKLIAENPATGLKRELGKDTRDKSELRAAFTAEQVALIVRTMAEKWAKFPDRIAAILRPSATGARIGEICQLTPADVRMNDDCAGWTLTITREGGKSTKNAPSVREIPIHSAVLPYVLAACERNARKPLLFTLAGDDWQGRVRAVGNLFSYMMGKQAGIADPSNMLSLHSARHWITKLANERGPDGRARLSDVELRAYLGHAQSDTYASKPDCRTLRTLIERLPVLGTR